MKRAVRPFVLLALMLLLLTGCSYVKQINRVSFVTGLGIEKAGEGLRVYALTAVPSRFASLAPGSGGAAIQNPNYVLSAEGSDLSEAMYRLKRKSARDLQYGHTKIYVFSEELAKEGLSRHIDLLMRRAEFQPIAWLTITRGSPRTILEARPQSPESVSDLFVDVFSQAGSDTFEILPEFVYEFFKQTHDAGQSPYAMEIKAIPEGNKIMFDGLGVFRGDRLAGYIEPEQVILLQMLQERYLKPTMITVNGLSLSLLNYKADIRVNDAQVTIRLTLNGEVDQKAFGESGKKQEIGALEKDMTSKLQQQMIGLIKRLQKLKSDPAGFGNRYRLYKGLDRLDEEQWLEQIYPQLKPVVQVRISIARSGTIR